MTQKNKWALIVVIAALVLGASIYLYIVNQPEDLLSSVAEKAESARLVRIMDPLEANNLHVPVAERRGFFLEEGLNVEVSYTSAGKFAMDALNSRAVEYAVVVDMNVAQTLFEHDDIAILTEIAEPITAIKLLGRSDRGIRTAEDLVGKKVGVLFGVNIHLFIERYLEDQEIDADEVELVNLRPPDAVAAFERGDIDAVVTWQPHVHRLQERLGDKVVVLTDDAQKYWTYKMIVVTRRTNLEQHAEEGKSLVRALVKADEFIDRDPDSAMTILADHLNMDKADVEAFFTEIHFETRVTPRLVEMIDYELTWLSREFYDGKDPVSNDVRSLLAATLREVNPRLYLVDASVK